MNTEREQKEFWAVTETGAVPVKGLSCGTENPKYWWVPQLGSSLCEGFHLFDCEEAALKQALFEMQQKLGICAINIRAIEAQMK